MTTQQSSIGATPPRGPLAWLERILSSEWTALIAFSILLNALHFTTLQAILAIIVYVQLTGRKAGWLRKPEQEHNNAQ